MEKMIENGQISVATSASEKIEKIASIINERHGVRADYTTIPSKLFRDYGIAWDNMPEFFVEIYKSYESGKWVVATEIFDNDYKTITKNKFESDYDRWSKKAVKDFADVIYNEINTGLVVKAEDNAEAVPAEVAAPTEYEVNYMSCANRFYNEIKSVVFKSKENADLFIALMEAEGYEIVNWDNSYMGDPKAIAAAKITTYGECKSLVMDEEEDITEAAPAEAETEDNNVYFTYNDIYEALNTILNAKSSKLQVELHKISDITDIPKSMCFYRQSSGNIGINFINYCDAEDPLAECYDFAEDYLRENASDIAFELSYRPFNDDPHPQTEDITEEDAEYKKAEAEAVKALPF